MVDQTQSRPVERGALASDLAVTWRLLMARLRGQMQYRASFISQIVGNAAIGLAEFASILVFFLHIDTLGGWTIGEIALLYGVATIGFGLGHLVASGLSGFSQMMVEGTFDQMLTRPVSPFLQVVGSDIQLRRLGHVVQGIVALVVGFSLVDVPWDAARVIALPAILALIAAIYVTLFALEATVSFWTTQGIEAVNIATYGGNTVGTYPIDVFADWLKGFFLFIVPLAFAVHIPMAWWLGKPVPLGLPAWIGLLSVPVIALFGLVIGMLWGIGVRRYRSAGS